MCPFVYILSAVKGFSQWIKSSTCWTSSIIRCFSVQQCRLFWNFHNSWAIATYSIFPFAFYVVFKTLVWTILGAAAFSDWRIGYFWVMGSCIWKSSRWHPILPARSVSFTKNKTPWKKRCVNCSKLCDRKPLWKGNCIIPLLLKLSTSPPVSLFVQCSLPLSPLLRQLLPCSQRFSSSQIKLRRKTAITTELRSGERA